MFHTVVPSSPPFVRPDRWETDAAHAAGRRCWVVKERLSIAAGNLGSTVVSVHRPGIRPSLPAMVSDARLGGRRSLPPRGQSGSPRRQSAIPGGAGRPRRAGFALRDSIGAAARVSRPAMPSPAKPGKCPRASGHAATRAKEIPTPSNNIELSASSSNSFMVAKSSTGRGCPRDFSYRSRLRSAK